MSADDDREQLLRRIEERRRSIGLYLRSTRPRAERLTYVAIISSALAGTLTAVPAVGGPNFTKSLADTFGLAGAADVWQPICIIAMLASFLAAISANLGKSKNFESRIVGAEACNAELEGLQTLVEFRQVSLKDAVKLYQQYVARIPFVEDATENDKRATPKRLRG